MQKNRESAKNSRYRKKLYIGLLEKKVLNHISYSQKGRRLK